MNLFFGLLKRYCKLITRLCFQIVKKVFVFIVILYGSWCVYDKHYKEDDFISCLKEVASIEKIYGMQYVNKDKNELNPFYKGIRYYFFPVLADGFLKNKKTYKDNFLNFFSTRQDLLENFSNLQVLYREMNVAIDTQKTKVAHCMFLKSKYNQFKFITIGEYPAMLMRMPLARTKTSDEIFAKPEVAELFTSQENLEDFRVRGDLSRMMINRPVYVKHKQCTANLVSSYNRVEAYSFYSRSIFVDKIVGFDVFLKRREEGFVSGGLLPHSYTKNKMFAGYFVIASPVCNLKNIICYFTKRDIYVMGNRSAQGHNKTIALENSLHYIVKTNESELYKKSLSYTHEEEDNPHLLGFYSLFGFNSLPFSFVSNGEMIVDKIKLFLYLNTNLYSPRYKKYQQELAR